MGKEKTERRQCDHIYQRTGHQNGETIQIGQRCQHKGRIDIDGKFSCWRHRYKRSKIYNTVKKLRRASKKQLLMHLKAEETLKEIRDSSYKAQFEPIVGK